MDLQDVIDELAERIGRAVEVEDRRWRLVAHSAHGAGQAADPVRLATILERRAPPAVAAWLDGLGLDRAQDLVDVPANPELGMRARVCAPLREGASVLGFLWVIAGPEPVGAAERDALREAAAAAGRALGARRQRLDERAELVTGLLRGEPAAAEGLGWPAGATFAVAAGHGPAEAVAAAVGRHWPADAIAVARVAAPGDEAPAAPGAFVAVARTAAGATAAAPAAALVAAGAVRAATGRPARGLEGLRPALEQARAALLVLEVDAARGPAAAFDALGGWAPVAELWLRAGRPAEPSPPAEALAAARGGAELLASAEAFLDAGADVSAAAAALHVHRATLHRRLERVGELTGLDLRDGDARLHLHLALRLRRLARHAAGGGS